MSKRIPNRWLLYKNIGEIIEGTRFIAFKVPLKEGTCYSLPEHERFTLNILLETVDNLGLIIDLTNTNRYYNSQELMNWNIEYKKIYCEGQQIPSPKIIEEFISTVDSYLQSNSGNNKLIGVHCTHGLNRTGYLVCRYMIEKMGIEPADALSRFAEARGHEMERRTYVDALKERLPKLSLRSGSKRPEYLFHDSRISSTSSHFSYDAHRDRRAVTSSSLESVRNYRESGYPKPREYHNHRRYYHERRIENTNGPRWDRRNSRSSSRSQRQPSAYDYRPWERNNNF